jgi:hypothetical protein
MTTPTNKTNNPQPLIKSASAEYPAFEIGQRVRVRDWCNEGDHQPYIVREWNKGRGIISPLEWTHGGIVPTELVTAAMIESI